VALPEESVRPVQPYEALPEEKQAMLDCARRHPGLRHRELAWRMVNENVACPSPSTVYRILKEANLVRPWRKRVKRRRAEEEKATRPNRRWVTDLMQLQVGERTCYFVHFVDEYSRYIVHHEVLVGMTSARISRIAATNCPWAAPQRRKKIGQPRRNGPTRRRPGPGRPGRTNTHRRARWRRGALLGGLAERAAVFLGLMSMFKKWPFRRSVKSLTSRDAADGCRRRAVSSTRSGSRASPSCPSWVVERTFAWLGRYRRPAKDYEYLPRKR
jgi:hypothetical protein